MKKLNKAWVGGIVAAIALLAMGSTIYTGYRQTTSLSTNYVSVINMTRGTSGVIYAISPSNFLEGLKGLSNWPAAGSGSGTIGEIEAATGVNIITSTEIDTMSELEALLSGVNVITSTEIDTSAELAAIVGDETGSGLLVFGTSPTIVTPTIASLVNANHNHQNSAGGGTLDAAAIAAGTVATSRLGSGTANSSTFLRGDSTWATPGGGGTVTSLYLDGVAVGLNLSSIQWSNSSAEFTVTGNSNSAIGTLVGVIGSAITRDTEWNTIAKIETATGENIITSTEIDTIGELETLLGGVNVLLATEIDTSAELRGILTDETGTGAAVFADTPTLTTPTIASFANATHSHQNSAGGGTLDAAAIAAGTMATARLGSGTANSTTYLRGDQTWATIASSTTPTNFPNVLVTNWLSFITTNIVGTNCIINMLGPQQVRFIQTNHAGVIILQNVPSAGMTSQTIELEVVDAPNPTTTTNYSLVTSNLMVVGRFDKVDGGTNNYLIRWNGSNVYLTARQTLTTGTGPLVGQTNATQYNVTIGNATPSKLAVYDGSKVLGSSTLGESDITSRQGGSSTLTNWSNLPTNALPTQAQVDAKQIGNAVLSNLVGNASSTVTNENSPVLQINGGVLSITPSALSNFVASAIAVIGNSFSNLYALKTAPHLPAITVSNLLLSTDTNEYELVGGTNVILTNFARLTTGVNTKIKVTVRNTLAASVPVVLPAFGAQHTYFMHTNGLNDLFATAVVPPGTNAVFIFNVEGTNLYGAVTMWRHP